MLFRVLLLLLFLASSVSGSEVRFREATDEFGLSSASGGRFRWCDLNRDGHPDLFCGRTYWENSGPDGAYRLANRTEAVGLKKLKGHPLVWDLDGDADPDIVTTRGQIWLQTPEGFFEAGPGIPLHRKTSTLGLGDYDGDGDPDLLAVMNENWNKGNPVYFPPQFFLNDGTGRFSEATDRLLLIGNPKRYGRSLAWCDFDRDGLPDAHVGNYRLQANQLLRSTGSALVDVGKEAGIRGELDRDRYHDTKMKRRYGPRFGHTIGATWGDFNGDGLFDLWVSNLVHKYVGPSGNGYDIRGYVCDDSKIYQNLGPPDFRFRNVRSKTGIAPKPIGPRGTFKGDELWSHAIGADVDNDGWLDVYVPQIYDLPYSHSLLYRNLGNWRFEEIGGPAGIRVFNTYGGAWADVNGDGRLDLVTSGPRKHKGKADVHLFVNETAGAGEVLRIRLRGSETLGAVGTVITESGRRITRMLQAGTGAYNQQNEPVLHFGLGGETPERLEILWPSGRVQVFRNPTGFRDRVLTEPDIETLDIPALELEGPAHEPLSIRLGQLKGNFLFHWDFEGDGRWDLVSETPAVHHRFLPGDHRVHVRILHATGRNEETGREYRTIRVTAR